MCIYIYMYVCGQPAARKRAGGSVEADRKREECGSCPQKGRWYRGVSGGFFCSFCCTVDYKQTSFPLFFCSVDFSLSCCMCGNTF